MKKLLALLFVCAGLTAMAINPVHPQVEKMPKGSMLMKSNTLSNDLTKHVVNGNLQGSLQEFFKTHDVSSNKLMKRVPRRANSYQDIEGSWIYSGVNYVDGEPVSYSMTGMDITVDSIVEAENYCLVSMGTWPFAVDPDGTGTEYQASDYGVIDAVGSYEPETNEFGILGGWMGIYMMNATKENQGTRNYKLNVKSWYVGLCDENSHVPGEGEDGTVASGTVDLDMGMINIEGKFAAAQAWTEYNYVISTNYWNQIVSLLAQNNIDTDDETVILYIINLFEDYCSSVTMVDSTFQAGPVFVGDNMMILPNATHNFDQVRKGKLNDTVWVQVPHVYELETGDTTVYTKEMVYDTLVNITEPVFAYQGENNDTIFTWNLWGIANIPDRVFTLTADGTVSFPLQAARYEDMSDYDEMYAASGYDFSNNFYNFKWMYAPYNEGGVQGFYETDVTQDDNACGVNEDMDVITWDGTDIMDIVTTEDDPDHFMFGIGYYPFINNMLTFDMPLTLPEPVETWKLGDVNHDTFVNVADVTALIQYILTSGEAPEVFYVGQANCDGDANATLNVADVTALIQIVLNQ